MIQLIPVTIMFTVTFVVATLMFLPMTCFDFKKKSALVNFYWCGFWIFLASIAALAGGKNTLMLAGLNADEFANATLMGTNAAFVFFVVFAWFRLAGAAATRLVIPAISRAFTR